MESFLEAVAQRAADLLGSARPAELDATRQLSSILDSDSLSQCLIHMSNATRFAVATLSRAWAQRVCDFWASELTRSGFHRSELGTTAGELGRLCVRGLRYRPLVRELESNAVQPDKVTRPCCPVHRETVTGTSSIVIARSRNNHVHLYMRASPLPPALIADIEAGRFPAAYSLEPLIAGFGASMPFFDHNTTERPPRPCWSSRWTRSTAGWSHSTAERTGGTPKSAAALLVQSLDEKYSWVEPLPAAADCVWASFSAPKQGPNLLLVQRSRNQLGRAPHLLDHVQCAFYWTCCEGPLGHESLRGVRFDLLETMLFVGGGPEQCDHPVQNVQAARKAMCNAVLCAKPSLQEPMVAFEVNGPSHVAPIDQLIARFGGTLLSEPRAAASAAAVRFELPLRCLEQRADVVHALRCAVGGTWTELFSRWRPMAGHLGSYVRETVEGSMGAARWELDIAGPQDATPSAASAAGELLDDERTLLQLVRQLRQDAAYREELDPEPSYETVWQGLPTPGGAQ